MATGSTWKGLREFERRIARLPDAIREEARRVLETSADEAVGLIRRNVARSGDDTPLADTARREDGRSDLSVDVILGDARTPYAAHLEFGHAARDGSHVAGEPAFFPAVNVVKKRTRARMGRVVRKVLRPK